MQYNIVANYFEKIAANPSRLIKTYYLNKLLQETSKESLSSVMLLLRGKIFPEWDSRDIGMSSNLVLKSISISTGYDINFLKDKWKKLGDIGLLAESLANKKTQHTLFSKKNSIQDIITTLQSLTNHTGQGSVDRKIKTLSSLLSSCDPLEAKYLVRAALQDLRIGIAEGTIRDAMIWAFKDDLKMSYDFEKGEIDYSKEGARKQFTDIQTTVQSALDKTNDYGKIAVIFKAKPYKEIEDIKIELEKPCKVMLAQKISNPEDALEKVGSPAAVEKKKDGFRMQIHKNDDSVTIFTRSLENVTKQFPEVVENIKKYVDSNKCIIDAEAVGFDNKSKQYLPFQNISQRIKRKHNVWDLAKKYPVEIFAFDLIYYEKEIISTEFHKRREILEKIVKQEDFKIKLIDQIYTSEPNKIKTFYDKALLEGNEGVMIKNQNSPYKPGSRTGHMLKMKPSMQELDLVIVAAEWGTGKRSGWLTSFTLACKDNDEYLEIGKVGTGLKEKGEGLTFEKLTKLLEPHIIKEKGREVQIKPKILLEIRFEEIQKSINYSAGYALRFPRVIRLREDKTDVTSLAEVKNAFENQ